MPKRILTLCILGFALGCTGGGDTTPPPVTKGTLVVLYSPRSSAAILSPSAGNIPVQSPDKTLFTGLPANTYQLTVSFDGYISKVMTVTILAGVTDTVSVTLAADPPVVTLTKSADSVEAGGVVTITPNLFAVVPGSCMASPGNFPVSGIFQVEVAQTTTYSVTCTGLDGSTVVSSTTVHVFVPPAIVTKLYGFTPSGLAPVQGVETLESSASWADSVFADADGVGSIPAPASVQSYLGDTVCLNAGVNSAYWPRAGCVTRARALASDTSAIGFVLPPREWNMIAGEFAGQSYAFDPSVPYGRASDSLTFYFATEIVRGQIPWGLDPTCASPAWTAADSILIDSRLAGIKNGLGTSYFRPAMMGEVIANTNGVRVCRSSSGGTTIGTAMVGIGPNNTITYGTVTFYGNNSIALHPGLVAHEFIHILGFGHRNGPSIMTPCTCSPLESDVMTLSDVALIQIWYTGKNIALDHGTTFDFINPAQNVGGPVSIRAPAVTGPRTILIVN